MRSPLLPFFFLLAGSLSAQDTLRVQTLTYDSITTRRGWWVFPDSTHTFRKVLMHHTLKCDPATTWDQYNCGEWDYLTYNFVHEHTGTLDSNALQHPLFKVGTAAPDSIDLLPFPATDLHQRWQVSRSVLSVNSESLHTIGVADTIETSLFPPGATHARAQYVFTAAELAAAGLQPGIEVRRLTIPLQNNSLNCDRMTVRVRHITGGLSSSFEETGLITVYDAPAALDQSPLILDLATPFMWDGFSDLLVDMAVQKADPLAQASVPAEDMGSPTGLIQSGNDGYLELNNDFVGVVQNPLATVNDQVTITFSVLGDGILPQSTSLFEAVDGAGRRQLNAHLPWSDGRVYWDAGDDGGGFDRIDKAATTTELEGQWNHWAFVKNTATGSMKIYLNGALWHSGTGKIKPMAGIVRMKIGSERDGLWNYPGMLDDFCVFNVEVSAADIATWAGRSVDPTHPNYAGLVQQFRFDEAWDEDRAMNDVDATAPGWLMGTVRRHQRPATELRKASMTTSIRPVITFVHADLVSQLDSALVLDERRMELLAQEIFDVAGNAVVPIDTVFGGLGGQWVSTYDVNGDSIGSAYASETVVHNDTLHYFGVPYEVLNDWEIGRYITPYGIGLTLGPLGFRWTFDVTDYQYLLHDSVELSAGNTQELIDLEFEMIEGTPPREVVRHQRPWGGLQSFSYAGLSNNTQLPPVTVDLDPTAAQWSLRSRLTGHGHASNDGSYPHCCEWKDNTHSLAVNGIPADDWHVWQTNDCAENPVYPQGGTWPGSREGWCPGDLVKDHMTEITSMVSGSSATLDYSITPVPSGNLGMGGGNYVVNMDLFEFGPATHSLDAEIYEVKRPSDADYFSRANPICMEPVVVLRNAGAQALTSATFTYSVSGGISEQHVWTGSLAHMESTEVILPVGSGWFWTGDSLHLFTVTASAPNGGIDGYADNDSYTTHFDLPVIYQDAMKVYYKTNNRPWENSVVIRDLYGGVVYEKDWGTLATNTIYTDTLHLTPGCYTLEMLDTGNDGLSYWADTAQGNGFLRLRKWNGQTLKSFENEFGRSIHWAFAYGEIVGLEETAEDFGMSIVPNPGTGSFTLQASGLHGPALIEVFDMRGESVLTRNAELYGDTRLGLDLEQQQDGLYLVRLTCEGRVAMARVIKQ